MLRHILAIVVGLSACFLGLVYHFLITASTKRREVTRVHFLEAALALGTARHWHHRPTARTGCLLVLASAATASLVAPIISLLILVVRTIFATSLILRPWHLWCARSTATERHASLRKRGLQEFRVELTADRSEKRFNLRQLHVLHILGMCHHLRLIREHLWRHASDHGLWVLIEVLLLVLVVVVATAVVLVALLLVAVLASWPAPLSLTTTVALFALDVALSLGTAGASLRTTRPSITVIIIALLIIIFVWVLALALAFVWFRFRGLCRCRLKSRLRSRVGS